ncbi:redoxin domain-containing protein [Paracoccus sp. SM22M-07]|uniref:redoxin domain-containing protein n=1 Tax=Paracoccus sp. SM22M-07 TaxID=1520813 RepID=UPI00091F0F76|nr:redoxin domain-containing protein [Paracoccus sp. SM22M-07]OJH44803.1 glutathione peroxidase [Paracoccus sp. SM22M-07]
MKRRLFLSLATVISAMGLTSVASRAADAPVFRFPSIDGGEYDTADWRGKPVLVVNTASLCGFAGQLTDMQALHDAYGDRGLVVLAVPSDDFNQELASGKEVSEYCQMEYGITLPMTDILHVAQGEVHPFYAWVRQQTGFVPKWNFNKVLIGPEGAILGSWGSFTKPGGPQISALFEPYLQG